MSCDPEDFDGEQSDCDDEVGTRCEGCDRNIDIRAHVGVTFALGQAVSFWDAPDGLAQVDGLLRTNVEVLYARKGHLCRARVPARALWRWQATRPLLFPADNPFGRAIVRPKSKTFTLEDPCPTNATIARS